MLGVTVFSAWERRVAGEVGRRASLKSYAATTLCLMGSSSLSNIALNYINYPTKVPSLATKPSTLHTAEPQPCLPSRAHP